MNSPLGWTQKRVPTSNINNIKLNYLVFPLFFHQTHTYFTTKSTECSSYRCVFHMDFNYGKILIILKEQMFSPFHCKGCLGRWVSRNHWNLWSQREVDLASFSGWDYHTLLGSLHLPVTSSSRIKHTQPIDESLSSCIHFAEYGLACCRNCILFSLFQRAQKRTQPNLQFQKCCHFCDCQAYIDEVCQALCSDSVEQEFI